MGHILIVSGGHIDETFALDVCSGREYKRIIGVDKGLEFLYRHTISPTDIVGDFDSMDTDLLSWYKEHTEAVIREYQPEKDATDTEIAILRALEYGCDHITVLGATGTRIDHMLGNIQLLHLPMRAGVPCEIVDAHNRIELIDRNVTLHKKQCFGSYVSLLPMTERVSGITLKGFKYPLQEYTLTNDNSLGISNELTEQTGTIEFREGILIKIESKD